VPLHTATIVRIVGPRLEPAVIVIEAETEGARMMLKLPLSAARELRRSLLMALSAAENSDLPRFMTGDAA
jgi:hypothetical protein